MRVFQQPFEAMRLSHYMRRYAAHDQVQLAALAAAARNVEAILEVLLAVNQDHEGPLASRTTPRMVVAELTLLCWCPARRGAGCLSKPLSAPSRVDEDLLE